MSLTVLSVTLAVIAIVLAFVTLVILVVRQGLVPSPFPHTYSGVLTDGLPEGYSIEYSGTIYLPIVKVITNNDPQVIVISDIDSGPDNLKQVPAGVEFKFVIIRFGNAIISINPLTGQVARNPQSQSKKFVVKKDGQIVS